MSNKIKLYIMEYCDEIDKCNINSISNVLNIHNKMNNIIIEKKDIEVNKINKYIEENKNSKEENIDKFIKFIKLKNKYIINEMIKLKDWENIINQLKDNIEKNIKEEIKKEIKKEEIEKLLIKKLLKKVNEFNGNWEIIELNNKGYPKKITLLDPEYEKFILENI